MCIRDSYSLISLPLGHTAAEQALELAARRGAMKPLSGKLQHVRAARLRTAVGTLDRTLVVVESEELLVGQKRGIAVALRRQLEQTRLVQRVLCTDQHNWSTGRIVYAFRGQWNVEELFRRAKKGGVVPWGPSHQWADGSLRLHTFAAVLGLMLVSLAKMALGTDASARETMKNLAAIRATLVRTTTGGPGRRPTVMLAPELTTEQRRAVRIFHLERWFPAIISCMTARPVRP